MVMYTTAPWRSASIFAFSAHALPRYSAASNCAALILDMAVAGGNNGCRSWCRCANAWQLVGAGQLVRRFMATRFW